jgi:hypothetical protein
LLITDGTIANCLVGVDQVVSLDTPTSISSKPFATIIAGIEVRIGHPDRPILLWADLPLRFGARALVITFKDYHIAGRDPAVAAT